MEMIRKQYKSINLHGISSRRIPNCLMQQFCVIGIAKKWSTIVSDDGEEVGAPFDFRSAVSHLHQWHAVLGFTRMSGCWIQMRLCKAKTNSSDISLFRSTKPTGWIEALGFTWMSECWIQMRLRKPSPVQKDISVSRSTQPTSWIEALGFTWILGCWIQMGLPKPSLIHRIFRFFVQPNLRVE